MERGNKMFTRSRKILRVTLLVGLGLFAYGLYRDNRILTYGGAILMGFEMLIQPFFLRCPHCGKPTRLSDTKICPHCKKKL